MSGIFCTFGPGRDDPGIWPAVRAHLSDLGTERWQTVRRPGGALAVGRYAWETAPSFSGDTLVAEEGPLVVVADASIYYREELRSRLTQAGRPPRSLTPTDLILAAWAAWGDDLCRHLEGDFAFVVWDRRDGRVFAARDLTGRRALFFASKGDRFAVSSSVRALLELPFVSADLNLAALGAQAAGLLWSSGEDTAFRDVHVVAAAHAVVWDGREARQTDPFWTPPPFPDGGDGNMAEAAEALRSLLQDAVEERMVPGVSTVWMSGGWDSPAVFAAGQSRLADRRRLRPISISYPEGDPGREDELIQAVADHWNADVHWIDSRRIPLLEDLVTRAAEAEEPPAHLYELWNVALARGTRTLGARVALDGAGGDQLFQVSDVVLADLVRRGRWGTALRHARARRHLGRKHALRAAAWPLLPRWALRGVEAATGRHLRLHYLERPMAAWIRPDFARRHELRERDLRVLDAVDAESYAQAETSFFLLSPVWGWGAAYMHRALLREGVEARSPLLDRRLADFALRRPVAERSHGRETKILLRKSMEGLLPAPVLAPRRYRTGVTVGFSRTRMQEAFPTLFEEAEHGGMRLADLGVLDLGVFKQALSRWPDGTGEFERINLFHTLKVEFWLRGLERRTDIVTHGPWEPCDQPLPPLSAVG